jgi:hypothetical protein
LGSGSVAIINCSFFDNFAAESAAIGVSAGTLTVRDSTFSYNVAHRDLVSGGMGAIGLYKATAEIRNSTFSHNYTSRSGGAIGSDEKSTLSLTSSTFFDNRADRYGGGIDIGGGGFLTLTNCTLVGNSALLGGAAIHNKAQLTMRSTLVAQSAETENCLNDGNFTDGGYNLEDARSCGFSAENHSLTDTNPLLGVLEDHGGGTATMALLPGSPAIDRISRGINGCGQEIASDQRGIKRPQGAARACDIGAFESRGFELLVMGGDRQGTAVNTAFPNPLSVLIFSRFEEPVDGGLVTFAGPQQGPGISPSVNSVITAGSWAKVRVMANNQAGTYRVKAVARGSKKSLRFSLNNKAMP